MVRPENLSALDVLRASFDLLVTEPDPLCVEAGAVAGLPDRDVPLDELRELLLARDCSWELRDAVWTRVIERARRGGREGAAWTVGACGLMLPALTTIAAIALAGVAGGGAGGELARRSDPLDQVELRDEVNAELLAAMVAALGTIDTSRPGIVSRLRWIAVRAARHAVRDALAAPAPAGSPAAALRRGRNPLARPPAPTPGRDTLTGTRTGALAGTTADATVGNAADTSAVVAQALAAGVLSLREADLIIATRLDGETLRSAGDRQGLRYSGVRSLRSRAERRLIAHLSPTTSSSTSSNSTSSNSTSSNSTSSSPTAGTPAGTDTGTDASGRVRS